MLAQTRELGIDLDGTRTEQRKAATEIARDVLKTAAAPDSGVVLLQMDVDALQHTGKLEAGAIKEVRIPGATTLKQWLGSSAPADFNLGVVTAIVQMVTLTFAAKDWAGSDKFSNDDNRKKFWASVASIFGNVIETISGTVEVAAKEPHPLSSFILKQWAGAERFTTIGKYGGRIMGSVAGAVLAWADLRKNAPEAFRNGEKVLGWLYGASGALGIYVAFFSMTGTVPFFWPVFVISIVIGIGIAILKSSELKDWISRCKFSKDAEQDAKKHPGKGVEHYDSLDAEIEAFNSAIGAW
jgi:hypothetical protein